ncbi:MAG TPA: hypothetical protein VG166_11320, partial [Caulobacteraceae bacterium]|nr:hypothetical protein [Caulobacteraceae bacterium]
MARIVWKNRAGGDWAVGADWRGGNVPGATDSAFIRKTNGPVFSAVDETVGSVQLTGSTKEFDVLGGNFVSTGLNNSTKIAVSLGSATFGGGGNSISNNGHIEATGGAVTFQGTTIRQGATATIEADGPTSTVTLVSANVDGGTLATTLGGVIETGDLNSSLNGRTTLGALTNTGTVRVNDHQGLSLLGSIINSGTIDVNGSTHVTRLFVNSAVTLSGGGQVTLDSRQSYIQGSAKIDNIDNTITGGGGFRAAVTGPMLLINEAGGTIDGTTGRMMLKTDATVTNDGLIESTGTGFLFVRDSTIDSSGGGTVSDGHTMRLDNATIEGGVLTIGSGALLSVAHHGGTVNLGGGTVSNAGDIRGSKGGLTIIGDVANNHVIDAVSKGSLTITGSVSGSGLARVSGSGVLEVDGAFGQHFTFLAGSTGALVLGDAAGFTGTVIGLAHDGSNQIDLKSVAFDASDTVTYTANKNTPTSGG